MAEKLILILMGILLKDLWSWVKTLVVERRKRNRKKKNQVEIEIEFI